MPDLFTIRKIPKGNGKWRTIYEPNKQVKERLQKLVPILEKIALEKCPPNVVHGFFPARSCVSNAAMHIGYEYTCCFDLTEFFDHCTTDMLAAALTTRQITEANNRDWIVVEGACRQGLPTSPAAANICAAMLDWSL